MSMIYIHLVVLLVCIGWAVGRGSDAISGEISRGTMDLLLSLPIRRFWVIVMSGVTSAVGSGILAFSIWVGVWIGTHVIRLDEPIWCRQLLPGSLNLWMMTFCLTAVTTLVSTVSRDRWRTICWAGGFFAVSSIITMVARLWEPGWWMAYFSFLSAYEPLKLILEADNSHTAAMAYWCNGTLLGVGLAAYLAATAIFSCRDIPTAY
jgi:ABC-2 type transport system permease protein